MATKLIYILPFLFSFCLIKEENKKPNINEANVLKEVVQNNFVEVISLGTGSKYKFKGMAITKNKLYGYFGSWNQKEIVKINLESKKATILNSPYNGKLNGMGTYIRNGKLYAVMNEVNDNVNAKAKSVLLVFNLETDKMIKSYEIKGDSSGRHHFNHVVVDKKGVAYISNTLKKGIYKVETEKLNSKIEVFLLNKEFSMIHGIDLSNDESKLFCTSYGGGIKFIDLNQKKVLSYSNPKENQNDGLIYDNKFLYGVGRNMIKRYKLNENETEIIDTEIIIKDYPKFNDPRCIQIIKDELYCLANIEIEPVRFRQTNKKMRTEALNDSHLIKLKIN